MTNKTNRKWVSYLDYNSPHQRLGVVMFAPFSGNRKPTRLEAVKYWLSRMNRGKYSKEDKKIRDVYGEK